MVKHTQTIGRQKPTNYLSVFDHFVNSSYNEPLQENVPDEAISKKSTFLLFWFSFKQILGIERKRLSRHQLLVISLIFALHKAWKVLLQERSFKFYPSWFPK